MKIPPTFKTTYQVAAGDVLLTVYVGEAQLGSSIAKLGEREVGRGDIEDLKIGKGSTLGGKKLRIKTVVTDTNDKTNHTSVRYLLRGGVVTAQHDLAVDVDKHGDSVIYRAEIEFVA